MIYDKIIKQEERRHESMVETNLPIILLKNVILFPYNEIRVEFTKSKEKTSYIC